jgi:hypothetical protein
VLVDCPQLSREQAAEIESRVRASLLTAEVSAAVVVTCESDGAEVRASTDQESVSRHVTAVPQALRDEVLRAVDELLEQLRHRPQALAESPPAPPTPADATATAVPAAPAPAPAAPAPSRAKPAPATPPVVAAARESVSTEPFASVAGEAWPSRLAAGLFLGVRRGSAALWYGVRAGAFQPFSADSAFGVTELSLAAQVELEPHFSRGVRLGLAGGPSWLWVSPRDPIVARSSGGKTALFFDAELSRPLWLGRFALVPAVGVRWFTAKRGVKLDGDERFELRGFVPRVAVGLAYGF